MAVFQIGDVKITANKIRSAKGNEVECIVSTLGIDMKIPMTKAQAGTLGDLFKALSK